jgi:hypothetical protein
MFMSFQQKIQRYSVKTGLKNFKYLAKTPTLHASRNCRFNWRNASYSSVHNLLSSHLLSENLKIKMYRIIILRVVRNGYETWFLVLREGHK